MLYKFPIFAKLDTTLKSKDVIKHMTKKVISILLLLTGMLQPQLKADEKQAILLDSLKTEIEQELYNNPSRIIHLYNQATSYYDKNPNMKAEFYYLYAMALRMKGDYDGSITILYDTFALLDKDKNLLMKGKIYDLMSKCYCTLHDFSTAKRLNEKATNIFKIHNDSVLLASAYNSRGIIHAHLNETEQADHFLKMALRINRQKKNLKAVAANLNNLCIYKGELMEKRGYLKEALIINKNLNAQWAIAENLNNMGKQYLYDKQYERALQVLEEAHNMAAEIDAKGLICDNYEYSAEIYEALGNYKKAYEKQVALQKLSLEIQSVNKLWAIERNVSQKQLRETQFEAEKQEQQYQMRLWTSYMASGLTMLLLIIILTLFLFQRYKRRKKIELIQAKMHIAQSDNEIAKLKLQQQEIEMANIQQALEASRKETTDVAVFMQSRNELLDKIYDQIKLCYKMDASEVNTNLKRINAFIKQNQATDKTNSSILQIIDQRSQEFVERLVQKHPNLTQGERHLATLLRVDISTKDIAILTGINPKSINMNRYRLRKSLNLAPDVELTTYLKSI